MVGLAGSADGHRRAQGLSAEYAGNSSPICAEAGENRLCERRRRRARPSFAVYFLRSASMSSSPICPYVGTAPAHTRFARRSHGDIMCDLTTGNNGYVDNGQL